jgi:hypothetical protein
MEQTKLKLLIPLCTIKKSPSAKNSLSKDKLKHLDLTDSAKKILTTKSKFDFKSFNSSKLVKRNLYGHVKSKINSLNKIPKPRVDTNFSEKETKTETVSIGKDSKSCIN